MSEFEYILVGGGLQSGLIAAAVRARQPAARLALIERGDRLGGNHTWCFHETDIEVRSRDWLEPFVAHRWPGYRVIFPNLTRTIEVEYSAVTSAALHAAVSRAVAEVPGSRLVLNEEASAIRASSVTLSSGETLHGAAIVDARGPPENLYPAAGYQKFLGLEVELEETHGLSWPILMDSCVEQSAGYRFFYVLPFTSTRLLIEDTYFHQSASLDVERVRQEILEYAASKGWTPRKTVREEMGILPMPWSGSMPSWPGRPLVAGYRGGWFHPGTGYSFPVAARLAEFVAMRPPSELFGRALTRLARYHRWQAYYCQFLNRLLFRWFPPTERRSIFERFYRMSNTTIGHFYALRLTSADRLRLLLGRPPRGLSLRYRLRHGTRA